MIPDREIVNSELNFHLSLPLVGSLLPQVLQRRVLPLDLFRGSSDEPDGEGVGWE